MTPQQRTAEIASRKNRREDGGEVVRHKIWIRDGWAYRDVYQVPIDSLVLNVDNKRFASERELVEHKLGRPLDPANNPIDEASIIAILCDSNLDVDADKGVAIGNESKDFQALRDDWGSRGQAEPLWIRPDGTVRNGNRRLAMLKRLRAAGSDKTYVEAIILEASDVDEHDLFRMEQREQLAENFKKRYQDVNALLALKDAAEIEGIDWTDPESISAIATKLKHYAGRDDAGYASKQLYAVRGLDAYLAYINAPGRYSLASRQVEVFREVGACISTYEGEASEQFELLQAAYAFVQAGRKYQDIRQLRRLFGIDRTAFDAMVAQITGIEDESGWDPDNDDADVEFPELADATAPEPDDDEEDEVELGGLVGSSTYPKAQIREVIDSALDRFAAQALDIRKRVDQARTRLESVDLSVLGALNGAERDTVRAAIDAIRTWADDALSTLE